MIFPSHVGRAACKVKLILIHVVFYLYLFCFVVFFLEGGGVGMEVRETIHIFERKFCFFA